jgi:hypothetical protein
MKKATITILLLSTAILLNGCIGLSLGGGTKTESNPPTLGQQLIDLKTAKDNGAITEAEYQAQKAKLLADQNK